MNVQHRKQAGGPAESRVEYQRQARPSPSVSAFAWISRPGFDASLIILVVVLAWSKSLLGPFQLDDYGSIVDNTSIRHLWPPDWLHPPATGGETVSGRPVLNFTFAVNHAIGGLEVTGYHVLNLLIHAAAAFALWGILRRTPAIGGSAVALAATLIWAVHPLQTAAVTYVVQRAEALAGLFGLLTLYAFVRGTAGDRRWFVLAVVSCLLGVGTKETVAVVPLIVLLYDRTFLAGGFRGAWRARGRVHLALFATWLPLVALVWVNHGRGGSAGLGSIGAGAYFLTQCEAVVHYLRLACWPAGQVFDYGMPVAGSFGAVWVQFLLLMVLAVGTLWQLVLNRPAGFAGACFFLLLAPSSSFVPVATQTMAEHRMYLALAAPVAIVCVTMAAGLRRLSPVRSLAAGLAAVVVIGLGFATFMRNQAYASERALWADTAAKRPDNPRAHYNLGLALAHAGRTGDADAEFRQTLALNPRHAYAHFELGKAALMAGRWDAAAEGFAGALEADPHFVNAQVNLARALMHQNRTDEAIAHFRQALVDEPGAADIRLDLARALITRGHAKEGVVLLGEALRLNAGAVPGAFELGNLLAGQQRFAEAIETYGAVLNRDPTHQDARANLANCLLCTGRFGEAIAQYEAVLRARPHDEATRENLRLAREAQSGQ